MVKNWQYCPVCGKKIPETDRTVKFCTNCGLDLEYMKINKEFPSDYVPKPIQEENLFRFYTTEPFIDEKDILKKRDEKIWSLRATFLVTLLAYFALLGVEVLVAIPFVLFSFGNMNSIISSPYFLIISSFTELVLILIPVRYIRKYLRQPTLKNRLTLLGFSTEEFSRTGIVKEVFIGLGFAVLGVFLVAITSYLIDLFVKLVFGVEIIYTSSGVDSYIASADVIAIILIAITMIVCVGFSEEVLFRGFMQRGLVRRLGVKWGILLNALIFSFIHIYTVFVYITELPQVFISIFLTMFIPYLSISLMLSYLFYWRKNNLIAVIIAHGVYDALTIIIVFIYFNFL